MTTCKDIVAKAILFKNNVAMPKTMGFRGYLSHPEHNLNFQGTASNHNTKNQLVKVISCRHLSFDCNDWGIFFH